MRPSSPGRGRRSRRLIVYLLIIGSVLVGASYFLPWYSIAGNYSTESFYPWGIQSVGTSSDPGQQVRSFGGSTLPTVGTLYADASLALLACAGLGVCAAVVVWLSQGTKQGRSVAFVLVLGALLLAIGAPLYVAAEQPSIICYDSIHNGNIGWSGPPPIGNQSSQPSGAPECSWVSWAPGGQWTKSGPIGPESTFVGSSDQPPFSPSMWGPSDGWLLALVGAAFLAIGAMLLALPLTGGGRLWERGKELPNDPIASGDTHGALWHRLAPRLREMKQHWARHRSLGAYLAAAGVIGLALSLLSAWYEVRQSGFVETFGPAGMGNSIWLGPAPPTGFSAANMPFTGLLYGLVAAAIGVGAVVGAIGVIVLLAGTGRHTLRWGRTLVVTAFLMAVVAPLGVAVAQPLAVCGDFPMSGGGGNSSLAGDHCYWLTQYASGGGGPAPVYGTGPGTGFSGQGTSQPGLAWGPSVGWILSLIAGAAFLGGAFLAGSHEDLASRRGSTERPTDGRRMNTPREPVPPPRS